MTASAPDNFLGLPAAESDYRTARFAVLPVPYDATTSYGVGTREGPRAILAASQQVELYDEDLGCEPRHGGVATLDPLAPDARGPAEMMQRIQATASRVIKDGKFLITLGGEHSITTPLVKAAMSRYRDLSVLQIDAHADLRAEYQNSPHSHASVMRRIHDLGAPSVAVGIRNYSADEAKFIRKTNKTIVSARRCHESKDWIGPAAGALTENVYVTIDIDGFDPAYAPGTGTPEPGGLNWYQVADLLAVVAQSRRIVAADVVEVRPIPPNTVTEFLAAKLIYRLIGLVSASSPGKSR